MAHDRVGYRCCTVSAAPATRPWVGRVRVVGTADVIDALDARQKCPFRRTPPPGQHRGGSFWSRLDLCPADRAVPTDGSCSDPRYASRPAASGRGPEQRALHGSSRACSSVDRASASEAEGRRSESCRARQSNLGRQRKRQAVGVRRRRESHRHDLPPCDDDLVVDGVEQVGLLRRNLSRSPRCRQRPEPCHGTLRRDPIGARALDVLLGIPEFVQPLEIDRVLEAAGGMLQRELADLALDPRLVGRYRSGP